MERVSNLTFEDICFELNSKQFYMHSDASDAVSLINSEERFEQVKENLMSKFGDVEVEIDPRQPWFDQVKIVDQKWQDAHKRYCDEKAAWCAKYGSN